jgi:hypothetical protein
MPWKECSVVDEHPRFVAQLLDGEPMTEVCHAFGISRKTGYKIFDRYKEHGLEPLPGLDSTQMRPPCISIIRFEMASPKPVSPFLRVIELSACWNSWNSFA